LSSNRFHIAVLVLLVPLGGCFFAWPDGPMLTPKTADFPFKKIVMEGDVKGTQDILVRDGDLYKDPDDKTFTMLFKKVTDDIFIAQQTFQGNPVRWIPSPIGYAIFKYDQNQGEISGFMCGNYSLATLESLGIEVVKNPAHVVIKLCRFKSLSQLLALSLKQPDGVDPLTKKKVLSIEQ
jgi:hypothetical protein